MPTHPDDNVTVAETLLEEAARAERCAMKARAQGALSLARDFDEKARARRVMAESLLQRARLANAACGLKQVI